MFSRRRPAGDESKRLMEQVDLVGPELSGGDKYLAAAALGSSIYALPYRARRAFRIHGITGEGELVGPDLGEGAKYTSAAVVGSCIYGLPADARRILKINGDTGEIALIGPEIPGGPSKYRAAAVVGRHIYGIPWKSARRVIRVDSSDDTVDYIGPELPAGQWKYRCAAVVEDRWVYGIPQDASRVLRIDGSTSTVDLVGPVLRGQDDKYLCAAAVGRRVFGVPCSAHHVLRITHGSKDCHIAQLPLPKAVRCQGGGSSLYRAAVVASEHIYEIPVSESIYALPYRAKQVMRIDGFSGEATVIGPDLGEGDVEVGDDCKYCAGAIVGHFVYAIPRDASHALRIDSDARTVETFGPALAGVDKYYCAATLNGSIYGIPYHAGQTLRIIRNFAKAEEDMVVPVSALSSVLTALITVVLYLLADDMRLTINR